MNTTPIAHVAVGSYQRAAGPPMLLVGVAGQVFENIGVSLDNRRFENCKFKNCDLFYSGGLVETSECYFENCRWQFLGTAAMTVQTMHNFGWTIQPPGNHGTFAPPIT